MKNFFILIFCLILLFLCQKSETSQDFSQNLQSENIENKTSLREDFHGFQIIFENNSKIFHTYDEMEKIFENNSEKILWFGDMWMVFDDDIASMPDFLVIKIIDKILENPEKISENFKILGLTESQIRSEKIFQKISKLPVKNLDFVMFYTDMDDFEAKFAQKFLETNFENVVLHSLENCHFVLENGEKIQEIKNEKTKITCQNSWAYTETSKLE